MPEAGFVYALINPNMPNLVKVGKTTRDPSDRAKELSGSTGVPTPFIVAYQIRTPDCHATEQALHQALSQQGHRVTDNREFFAAPLLSIITMMVEVQRQLEQWPSSTGSEAPTLPISIPYGTGLPQRKSKHGLPRTLGVPDLSQLPDKPEGTPREHLIAGWDTIKTVSNGKVQAYRPYDSATYVAALHEAMLYFLADKVEPLSGFLLSAELERLERPPLEQRDAAAIHDAESAVKAMAYIWKNATATDLLLSRLYLRAGHPPDYVTALGYARHFASKNHPIAYAHIAGILKHHEKTLGTPGFYPDVMLECWDQYIQLAARYRNPELVFDFLMPYVKAVPRWALRVQDVETLLQHPQVKNLKGKTIAGTWVDYEKLRDRIWKAIA